MSKKLTERISNLEKNALELAEYYSDLVKKLDADGYTITNPHNSITEIGTTLGDGVMIQTKQNIFFSVYPQSQDHAAMVQLDGVKHGINKKNIENNTISEEIFLLAETTVQDALTICNDEFKSK